MIDKYKFRQIAGSLLFLLFLTACSKDNGPEDPEKYTIARCKVQEIKAENTTAAAYHWEVVQAPDESLYSLTEIDNRVARFAAVTPGIYGLQVTIGGTQTETYSVEVTQEVELYRNYIANVYDYKPAPGQFINDLPEYASGDDAATMTAKAEEWLARKSATMISLGGFGGYVVFGFDHTIVNVPGKRDFRVLGNAFWSEKPEYGAKRGGSSEPGVVMVAYDRNGNGRPDDNEWYEIAGSEYDNPRTVHNYEITYYKPDSEKQPIPGNESWQADIEHIRWVDNQGGSGYLTQNNFTNHSLLYWPQWITDESVTFRGTLLPDNGEDTQGDGSYYVLYAFGYGYADNAPNNDDDSAIDIDWAVDANGDRINLPGIDFVKVYSAVNQECGWLGETSTEVAGAIDLHLAGISIDSK